MLKIYTILKKKFPDSPLLLDYSLFKIFIKSKYLEVFTPLNNNEYVIVLLRKQNYGSLKFKFFLFLIMNFNFFIKNSKKIIKSYLRNFNIKMFNADNSAFYMLYLVISSKKINKKKKDKLFIKTLTNFARDNKYNFVFAHFKKTNFRAKKFYKRNKFQSFNENKELLRITRLL